MKLFIPNAQFVAMLNGEGPYEIPSCDCAQCMTQRGASRMEIEVSGWNDLADLERTNSDPATKPNIKIHHANYWTR